MSRRRRRFRVWSYRIAAFMCTDGKPPSMRILRVAQKLYPDTKGGGQYHVYAMSRDQAEQGHEVTVLTTRDHDGQPRLEHRDGFTVVRVDPGVTVAGNDVSPAIGRYLWTVSLEEFDVVHAHSHLYFATNLAAMKRRLGDVPLAITNHGLYSQSASKRIFGWYLRTGGRWTFDRADVVFCYTEAEADRVRALGVGSHLEVVPNGIDAERFTPAGPNSEKIDQEDPVVLFVGRLVPGKRPGDAIRAFTEVRRSPDASLYLCGDGPLRDDLEALAVELDVRESVHFLGHLPYDEMPRIYRSGDVLALPSRCEGVPRTVLEAMASGVPVVTSDLPQLRAIVADAGETVPVGSTRELAERLALLLDSSAERDRLGSNGRRRVLSDHRWCETVERTTSRLMELVGREKPR